MTIWHNVCNESVKENFPLTVQSNDPQFPGDRKSIFVLTEMEERRAFFLEQHFPQRKYIYLNHSYNKYNKCVLNFHIKTV